MNFVFKFAIFTFISAHSLWAEEAICKFQSGNISFSVNNDGIPTPNCKSTYSNSHIHGYLFNCITDNDIIYYSVAFDLSYGAKVFNYTETNSARVDETIFCEKL